MSKIILSEVKDTKVSEIELEVLAVILNDLNVLQKDARNILAIYSFSESRPPNHKEGNLLPF